MKKITPSQLDEMMNHILHVRYSDPELEKSLCLKLLQWEKEYNDSYIQAFALTYLGDYFIGIDDGEQCIHHLKQARDISLEHDYNELLVRIYSLLGYYYNSIADEQSALEYYIEGITVCHEVKDIMNEGLILNNIGYNLQQRHGYQQALKFYKDAFELLQSCDEPSPVLGILLNNLATVSTLLNQLDESKQYILACEEVCKGSDQYVIFRSQNWCQYYAAKKERQNAIYWADVILSQEASDIENKRYSFDIYLILFDCMVQLGDVEYAKKFLSLLEKYKSGNSFIQRQEIEIRNMKYAICFEQDEVKQANAYKRYATQIQSLDDSRNITITNGLKDAIHFHQISRQKEQLDHEKKNLSTQVNIDELTRVYTRHYLDILMDTYRQQAYDSIGFIMIDVDCLKEYNDTYGHVDGDKVLSYIGSLLNQHRHEDIYPCRFGGDEFVCFCMNCNDEEIEKYIQSIRNELHKMHIAHKASRCSNEVTLSIGYSNELENRNMQEVLKLADQALYSAKLNGRNTFYKYV